MKDTASELDNKLIRFSFRYKKKVTSIAIKSYIVALYLTLNNVKRNEREFMRETINLKLKDMDYRKKNKGLSEAISIKLLEDLLDREDKNNFYRHLMRLQEDE